LIKKTLIINLFKTDNTFWSINYFAIIERNITLFDKKVMNTH